MNSYSPPRARWYGRLWYPWNRLTRHLPRTAFLDGREVPWGRLCLGAAGPGLPWVWYGRPLFAMILGPAYVVAATVFLLWLGYPAASVALTCLLSIHCSSLLHLHRAFTPRIELGKRLVASVLAFVILGQLVYWPLYGVMERHWCRPLQIGDRVVVIRPGVIPARVQRGDWVAYQIHANRSGLVRVADGLGLGPVSALAGDRIAFAKDGFAVNGGSSQSRQPDMPTDGELVVADRCWFIWPTVAIRGYHGMSATVTEAALLRLAVVPELDLIGVPYRRWGWRRQQMP